MFCWRFPSYADLCANPPPPTQSKLVYRTQRRAEWRTVISVNGICCLLNFHNYWDANNNRIDCKSYGWRTGNHLKVSQISVSLYIAVASKVLSANSHVIDLGRVRSGQTNFAAMRLSTHCWYSVGIQYKTCSWNSEKKTWKV